MLRCVLASLVLAACVDNAAERTTAPAPLVGIDGSQDAADRNCHVVLRELARPWIGHTWETHGSSWVWVGTIEISEEAAAEGLVPSLLYQYGSNPTWFEASATPAPAAPTPGFARFTVRVDHDLPGPGMSGTALANARVQAIPMLRLPQGGRLFDHNRHPGDFDNYVMTSPDFAVAWDDSVCAPPAGAPAWVGNARTLFSRDTSADICDGVAAEQGFTFDTWTRQRAAITNLCFEVWEPGLTDRDDPDLWKKLDVSVRWRGEGQSTWQSRYVNLDRRVGNNARYALSWRDLDPFRTYHCPDVPTGPTSDGMYVQARLEYVIVVNGFELSPAPGVAYAGTFIDYANDSWRAQNCP